MVDRGRGLQRASDYLDCIPTKESTVTAKIGPYKLDQVRFSPDRDELDLWTGDSGLAIMDCETSDGDRWFVPANESTEFTGIEIERVKARAQGGLTVELPTGERVRVEGIDSIIGAPGSD
ncbi:MAG: hypothetical protein KDB54_06175 [Solirubrobacterales bacterium]|nr:hypothetical protein [Solirubrobacterales bacterium]HRV59751.1 hypothetical protein [Solirubrobacterales bacterium]